jgi:hypothetical protein
MQPQNVLPQIGKLYKSRHKKFLSAFLHFSPSSGTIQVQVKNDSCNEVLRARADTYHSVLMGVSSQSRFETPFLFHSASSLSAGK